MMVFRELRAALAHAADGGQAVHLHTIIGDRSAAPRCFVQAVDRGELRLVATVRRLGVRVVVVERGGTDRQHVDLCGAPLRKAIAAGEKGSDA